MLYRFKSRAAADVVMLEPHGRQLLEILGKDPDAPGILLVDQMPDAVAAVQAAVEADDRRRAAAQEAARQAAEAEGRPDGDEDPDATPADRVTLRMRMTPFLTLIRYSQAEGVDIVWGV